MSTVEAINNLAIVAKVDKKTIAKLMYSNAIFIKTNVELVWFIAKLEALLGKNKLQPLKDDKKEKECKYSNQNYY